MVRRVALRAVRWIGYFLGGVTLLVTSVLILPSDPCQELQTNAVFPAVPSLNSGRYDLDSLDTLYGNNKVLPPGFEKQALLALAAYPELKDVYISFELVQYGAPLESSFHIPTLLGAGKNRKYRIMILDDNNASGFLREILLRNLPFDSQVGILAHELAHTVYYHQRSTWGVLKWAVCYGLDSDFRANHEKSSDLLPVYRGLGYQIHDYAEYVRTGPNTAPLYESVKGFLDRYYHTHTRILQEMEQVGIYDIDSH